jgi:hypothetical protein
MASYSTDSISEANHKQDLHNKNSTSLRTIFSSIQQFLPSFLVDSYRLQDLLLFENLE